MLHSLKPPLEFIRLLTEGWGSVSGLNHPTLVQALTGFVEHITLTVG